MASKHTAICILHDVLLYDSKTKCLKAMEHAHHHMRQNVWLKWSKQSYSPYDDRGTGDGKEVGT